MFCFVESRTYKLFLSRNQWLETICKNNTRKKREGNNDVESVTFPPIFSRMSLPLLVGAATAAGAASGLVK